MEICIEKSQKLKEEYDSYLSGTCTPKHRHQSPASELMIILQLCDSPPEHITKSDLQTIKQYVRQINSQKEDAILQLEEHREQDKTRSVNLTLGLFLHMEELISVMQDQQCLFFQRLDQVRIENDAFQTALQDIGKIVTAVAKGDLTQSAEITGTELHCEIATFKKVTVFTTSVQIIRLPDLHQSINGMINLLQNFASEVSRVAFEVGTKGQLGGQAPIEGTQGTWKELTENGKKAMFMVADTYSQ